MFGETLEQVGQYVVVAPSLEISKVCGDGDLNNLTQWKVALPRSGGIGLDDLWWSLPNKLFCDFMILLRNAL